MVLAVSRDGFLCRGPADDMRWTGVEDKRVFRALTSVGGVCAVGRGTAAFMPPHLPGRQLLVLSRDPARGMTLGQFAERHPDGWLLGGPTVAVAALYADLLDEVHLCWNGVVLGGGIRDHVTPMMHDSKQRPWTLAWSRNEAGVLVETWRRLRLG